MKCIDGCSYRVMPNNLPALKAHVEDCLDSGPCKDLKNEPEIIWQDGEFTVVAKSKKKDTTFKVDYVKKQAVELTPDKIKVPQGKQKKPNVSRGGIEKGPNTKQLRATDIKPKDDDFI